MRYAVLWHEEEKWAEQALLTDSSTPAEGLCRINTLEIPCFEATVKDPIHLTIFSEIW